MALDDPTKLKQPPPPKFDDWVKEQPFALLDNLKSFAAQNQLEVGSTTGGRHNRGSKHYSGRAIDLRNSGQLPDQQVAELSAKAAASGLKLRDERRRPKGQAVWGGPHLHVEVADQQIPKFDEWEPAGQTAAPPTRAISRQPAPPAPPPQGLQVGAKVGQPEGPSFSARQPSTFERIKETVAPYVPGLTSIDTPAGLKTDALRGVLRGLTLGALGDSREITPEEKVLNPQAEGEQQAREVVGETAAAVVPYIGAAKLLRAIPALRGAGRAVSTVRTAATLGGVEAAREGVHSAKTGEAIRPSEIAISTAIGAAMGAIPGANPSWKRTVIAAVGPQVVTDAARGVPIEQAAQSAVTNLLFGAHEAAGRPRGVPAKRIAEIRAEIARGGGRPQEVTRQLGRNRQIEQSETDRDAIRQQLGEVAPNEPPQQAQVAQPEPTATTNRARDTVAQVEPTVPETRVAPEGVEAGQVGTQVVELPPHHSTTQARRTTRRGGHHKGEFAPSGAKSAEQPAGMSVATTERLKVENPTEYKRRLQQHIDYRNSLLSDEAKLKARANEQGQEVESYRNLLRENNAANAAEISLLSPESLPAEQPATPTPAIEPRVTPAAGTQATTAPALEVTTLNGRTYTRQPDGTWTRDDGRRVGGMVVERLNEQVRSQVPDVATEPAPRQKGAQGATVTPLAPPEPTTTQAAREAGAEPPSARAATPELQRFADEAASIRAKASDSLTSIERAAIERKAARLDAKSRGERLQRSGADPYELIDDIIIRGGELIREGKVAYDEWSKRIRAELGGETEPHLKRIYAQLRSERESSTTEHVQGERQLPKSLEASSLPAGTERFYEVKSHVESRDKARQIIKERGVEGASNWVQQGERPSAEQSATALELIEGLANEAYRETNPEVRAAKIIQAGELANTMSVRSTEAGQAISYLATLAKESPEGALYYAEKAVRRNSPDAKLSAEQRKGVFETAAKLKSTEAELVTIREQLADTQRKLAGQGRLPPQRSESQVSKHLREWADRAEKDARARLAARTGVKGSEAGASTIPADIADYAIIGAAKLTRGTVNFAEWSKQMADEFGDDVKSRLREIRAASQRVLDEQTRIGRNKRVIDEVARLGGERHAEQRLVDEAAKFAEGMSRTEFQRQVKHRYNLTVEQAHEMTAQAYKLYADAQRSLRASGKERAALKQEPDASPERVRELVKQRDDLFKQRGKERRELQSLLRSVEQGGPSIGQRLNNQYRGIIVSALQTASRNLGTQTLRTGVESLTDAFELALVKAARKTGLKVKEGDIDPNTRMLDTLKSSTYLLQRNKRIAEGVLDEFPVEYERMFRRFSSDIELSEQSKTSKGIHKGLDYIDRGVEILNTVNRFQEFLGRRAMFRGVLEARLRARGIDLNKIVRQGEQASIPREDIQAAVDKALEVTFAQSPKHGTKADAFVRLTSSAPAPINPLTFSRFLYNGAKFTMEYQPTTAVRGLYRTAKGQAGASRDYAKAAIGTAMLLTGVGVYDSMHEDGSEWYLLKNPLTGNEFDIRGYQPFASYVFLAHFLRTKQQGKPISNEPSRGSRLGTYAEGLTGLSARPNPVFEGLKQASTENWEGALKQVKRMAGESVAGLLTPLKTPEQILQHFDKNEAIQRDTREEPFLGPIKNVIPRVRQSLPPRVNKRTGEPLVQPNPLLLPLGVREVDPNSKYRSTASVIEPYIDQRRSHRISDTDIDAMVEQGTISKNEGDRIKDEGGRTIQEAGFNKKDPKDALESFRRMSPTQQEEVREIMRYKAWSLLYSGSEQEDATRKAQRQMRLQQDFDRLGIDPKDPRKKDGVSGLRNRVQSAFA